MRDPFLRAGLGVVSADGCGAVHLDECRVAGLSDRQIGWLIESRRWQSIFPRVYATFSGPLPWPTRAHAAMKYCGPGACLSHVTAGYLWGLAPVGDILHATVPYRRQVDDQPGLRIHRSRTLSSGDIYTALSPLRTRIERTILDMLATCRTAESALALVGDAVRSRKTTTAAIREALRLRTRTRWRAQIMLALPDVSAGAHSLLELREARLRRRHGIPPGTRQFRRLRNGVEMLDVVNEEFDLHVELDGRLGHDATRETWRDMDRDNASELHGIRHLRYGWADVAVRPCYVAMQEAIVLRQQGWTGAFRRCPVCPNPLPPSLCEP